MARRILLTLLALSLGAAAPARPRVVLALSGGGAYGQMYLGALEWLERHRVPVDAIVGTSGGALVGGGYATGIEMLSDEQILHPAEPRRAADLTLRDAAPIIDTVDFAHLFDSGPRYESLSMLQKEERRRYPNDLYAGLAGVRGLRRDGLVPGQAVGHFIDRFARDYGQGFANLPTPFRAVATDATEPDPKAWRTVVLGGPDAPFALGLAQAIRASIAVPFLFTPVEVGGRRLVDGALVDNFPSDVAIDEFRPDVLIGLRWDNGSGPDPYRPGRGGREPGTKTIVTLDPRPYRVDQFDKWRELAWIGYRGMEARRAELERYALPPAEYLAYRHARRARTVDRNVARVAGDVGGLDDVRRAVVGRDLDDPAVLRALEDALDRLVADQGLATAGYDVRPGGLLFVRTTRLRGAAATVRAGLDLDANSGDRPYGGVVGRISDLRAGRTQAYLDARAGNEPSFSGGLELPLGRGLSVGPTFRLDRQFEYRFDGDARRSAATISTSEAALGLFYRPSRSLEFALGGFAGANGADDRSGRPFRAETGAYRGLFARAALDSTDDPLVPARGARASLLGRSFDGDFTQLSGALEAYRGALGARAEFGTSFGGDAPFPFEFRPELLPYRRDEVRDDAYGLLGLSATLPLAPFPFALGRTYLVGRLENAWASGHAYPGATLSLLATTRAGAASFGVGVAEHGAVRFLLGLGRRF